jgi:hypothetical protein
MANELINPIPVPIIESDPKLEKQIKIGKEKAEKLFPKEGKITEDVFSSKITKKHGPIELDICTQKLFDQGSFEVSKIEPAYSILHNFKGYSTPTIMFLIGQSRGSRPIYRIYGAYHGTFLLLKLSQSDKGLRGYAAVEADPNVSFQRLRFKKSGVDFSYTLTPDAIIEEDSFTQNAEAIGYARSFADAALSILGFGPPFKETRYVGDINEIDYRKITTNETLKILTKKLNL